MLCFDDGTIILGDEAEGAVWVDGLVVGGGTWVGRVHICVGIGHGVFAAIHEDACVAHVGVGWVCNCHCFGNALILEGTNGVDIGASDEGGESAKRREEVRIFQFLDGGHFDAVVDAEGGTTVWSGSQERGSNSLKFY